MKNLSDNDEVFIKKFDPKTIKHDKILIFIGSRGSGKSSLLKDIMYYHKDIPVGTCISITEEANPFFRHFMPKPFIHKTINMKAVENALKRQKMIKKTLHKEKNPDIRKKIDPRAFLILDDCQCIKDWTKKEIIREIFFNGRHYNLMFLITMQYSLGIPPELRTNVDYSFIFAETNIGNRKRLYENYAGVIPNFEMFNRLMNLCTKNHECLVIDNTSTSTELEDRVYWYKAEFHEQFHVGSPNFWSYNDDASSESDVETVEPVDTKDLKREMSHLRIKKKHT